MPLWAAVCLIAAVLLVAPPIVGYVSEGEAGLDFFIVCQFLAFGYIVPPIAALFAAASFVRLLVKRINDRDDPRHLKRPPDAS